jgi:hypothetical protein
VGCFDPDCVRAGLRRLAYDDCQKDGSWECRERFPFDILGQNSFENLLPRLVRVAFALLGALRGAGYLTHTNSFVKKM